MESPRKRREPFICDGDEVLPLPDALGKAPPPGDVPAANGPNNWTAKKIEQNSVKMITFL